MAKKTKKCAFCGEEYESNDKSVNLCQIQDVIF